MVKEIRNSVFTVEASKDPHIEASYRKAMSELKGFFELDWTFNKPKIFIMLSRKTQDDLWEEKQEDRVLAWPRGGYVYILDESQARSWQKKHYYSNYFLEIKHELAHVFFNQLIGELFNRQPKPIWLWEGVSIYLEGATKLGAANSRPRPECFKDFLKYYDRHTLAEKGNEGVYRESGFVVEFLINKYGKKKLLTLIKSIRWANTKKKFADSFKKIYGFELNYKNFNSK